MHGSNEVGHSSPESLAGGIEMSKNTVQLDTLAELLSRPTADTLAQMFRASLTALSVMAFLTGLPSISTKPAVFNPKTLQCCWRLNNQVWRLRLEDGSCDTTLKSL